jgi:hypothetical protein
MYSVKEEVAVGNITFGVGEASCSSAVSVGVADVSACETGVWVGVGEASCSSAVSVGVADVSACETGVLVGVVVGSGVRDGVADTENVGVDVGLWRLNGMTSGFTIRTLAQASSASSKNSSSAARKR